MPCGFKSRRTPHADADATGPCISYRTPTRMLATDKANPIRHSTKASAPVTRTRFSHGQVTPQGSELGKAATQTCRNARRLIHKCSTPAPASHADDVHKTPNTAHDLEAHGERSPSAGLALLGMHKSPKVVAPRGVRRKVIRADNCATFNKGSGVTGLILKSCQKRPNRDSAWLNTFINIKESPSTACIGIFMGTLIERQR